MRTRIALVAIFTFAFIIIGTLIQAATPESARAEAVSSSKTKLSTPVGLDPVQLVAYRGLTSGALPVRPVPRPSLPLDLNAALISDRLTPLDNPAPGPAAAVTATASEPVDTVTPDQRAAWERVALCEEGGDWRSNGPTFSGGLGISRANWRSYGGREFAPSGAMATEDQQIMVAERIESDPPDQYGCRGW
jgi:Transglycosylase-like domain